MEKSNYKIPDFLNNGKNKDTEFKGIPFLNNDREDLNKSQEKLINQEGSKQSKPKLPTGEKLSKRELTPDLCIALIYIYKFYRHNENAVLGQYYTRKDFFADLIGVKEYNNIVNNYTKLKWWGLIEPMPTHPTKVIYKKGWWTITENAIGFVQRELGMPKYALIHNDHAYEHITNDYVMIEDALKEVNINYDEIIII